MTDEIHPLMPILVGGAQFTQRTAKANVVDGLSAVAMLAKVAAAALADSGVALIPLNAFFKDGTPHHMVRFAFCKKHDVIDEAVARLEKYFAT
jgi:hypothetical protein